MDDLVLPQPRIKNRRQAYYNEYGPPLARQMEFDTLVGLMLAATGMSKDEFFEKVEAALRAEDDIRKVAAGFRD
jgi:hypothetical protein